MARKQVEEVVEVAEDDAVEEAAEPELTSVESESEQQPEDGLSFAESPAALFQQNAEEPKADEKPAEAKTTEDVAGTAPAQPPAQPAAEEKVYTLWDGRKLTREQIAADPSLLEDLVATRGKYPSLQRAHAELIQSVKDAQQREQSSATRREESPSQPARQGRLSPEEWRKQMEPHVKELVSAGYLSQDTAEMTPDIAAIIADQHLTNLRYANMFNELILPAISLVGKISEAAISEMNTNETERFAQRVEGLLDRVASSSELFSPLKDAETRDSFLQTISGPPYNIKAGQLNGSEDDAMRLITTLFRGWVTDDVLLARASQESRTKAAETTKRSNTAGEAVAANVGSGAKGKNADIRALLGGG